MSKVNRNAPRRAAGSEATYTLEEFNREFPDDAACLEHLVRTLYPDGILCPKCRKVTRHHRIASRPSYSCQSCGRHEHPMAGTIFQDSATSLRLWFYAIYLMASTRCGISAKQLERETGVTYKCAWRMFNRIRSLVPQTEDKPMGGTVEMDEAFIGGKAKWKNCGRPTGIGPSEGKAIVHGIAERGRDGKHGRVSVSVIPTNSVKAIMPRVVEKVLPSTTVYTDTWVAYDALDQMGHRHSRINHDQKVYVSGDVHTNTIEGFWSLVKRGISGVYHGVSAKHLPAYLDEYAFRYNNRDATERRGMFDAFLSRVRKVSLASASAAPGA